MGEDMQEDKQEEILFKRQERTEEDQRWGTLSGTCATGAAPSKGLPPVEAAHWSRDTP